MVINNSVLLKLKSVYLVVSSMIIVCLVSAATVVDILLMHVCVMNYI